MQIVGSSRFSQLEDELAAQQRQLDTMRKTLACCVDVVTHRQYKEQISAKLAEKADADLVYKHHMDATEQLQMQREQLFEALANKVDSSLLAQCQKELEKCTQDSLGSTAALEEKLSRAVADLTAETHDLQQRHASLLSGSLSLEQAVTHSLAEKADVQSLEEQERRIMENTQEIAQRLEKLRVEAAQEQHSASVSAEMRSEVLHIKHTTAIEQQQAALDKTKGEFVTLEKQMKSLCAEQRDFSEQVVAQVIAKQDEWYREKDQEQYLLALARKERQDHQLVHELAKKADVAWYEQQKALLDATQISLTALNSRVQDVEAKLGEKIDASRMETLSECFQREILKARQDTLEVSRTIDRFGENNEMMRAQLLEVIRQQADVEMALSTKVDKDQMELFRESFERLICKVAAVEQKQDMKNDAVIGQLQDQMASAARQSTRQGTPAFPPHGVGNPQGMNQMAIVQPPSSPREKGMKKNPREKGSPYLMKRR